MKILEFIIDKQVLVKDFILQRFSRRIYTLIKNENGIFVNGKNEFSNYLLNKNDKLTLKINETLCNDCPPKKQDIKVVFEDEDILVITKGKNIASVPTKAHYNDNLFCGLKYLYQDGVFRIVTRLDKDTTGLMLIAKNKLAHSILCEDAKINRKYVALIGGKLEKDDFTISAPIDRISGMKRGVVENGKDSVTHLKILEYIKDDTLVLLSPITGRTHQLRVHMAHIGHPIVGDKLYGGKTNDVHTNGQELKCVYLEFNHPITKKMCKFQLNFQI